MKKILGIILLATSLLANAATLPVMDATKLQSFDGQNGHKAYVALNGYVYDVTGVKAWKDGKHKKGMHAGVDLTPYIDQSPHGAGIVVKLKLQPIATYQK